MPGRAASSPVGGPNTRFYERAQLTLALSSVSRVVQPLQVVPRIGLTSSAIPGGVIGTCWGLDGGRARRRPFADAWK